MNHNNTKKKESQQFEFCEVCRLNHNHARRHNFFPTHKTHLANLLTRFHSRISHVTPFLKTPSFSRPDEHAPRNRLWCVFCDRDVVGPGSPFACGDAIEHLASGEHWKRVKGFMWKYGGGMDRVDSFRVSEVDYAKWAQKCKSLKIEAKEEPVGPSNNIHNELNDDSVNFCKNNDISFNFSIPSGVAPLHRYTNERRQVSSSVLSPISEPVPALPNISGVRVGDTQNMKSSTGYMDNRHCSNSLAGECSSNGYFSNGSVYSGVRTTNEEKVSHGSLKLTQICCTSKVAIDGNVHTGAPPPWFDTTNGNQLDLAGKPELSDFVSSKARKSSKLNPKRVGAAWAERRKLELELERRGEFVDNQFDADWLPNFGRVWQSGTRKESKKEFGMEKKASVKADNQSEKSITLQPYVSKRMRRETSD